MSRPASPAVSLAPATAAVGLVLLAALTLTYPSATRMHTWPWATIAALLWLLPIGALIATLSRATAWRMPNRAIATGAILLAVSALGSAWASPFSAASLARVWPTLGGTAFYFWLHHWLSTGDESSLARANRVVQIIAGAAVVLVIVSSASFTREALRSTWVLRNTHPFGHSNYVAGALVLFLPWLVLAIFRARRAERWLAVAMIALAGFALVKTSSRGGAMAIVAELALGLLALWLELRWSRPRKILLAGICAAAALAVVFSNARLRDLAFGRGWSDAARESNRQRSAMLEAGVRLGQQRPLLGWGPGTVPLVYPRVRASLDGGSENVLQLHNTPGQIWATLGASGLTAIALLGVGSTMAAVRAWRKTAERPLLLAATSSLFGYAVLSLTDHQFDLPAIVALSASTLALLTAMAADGHSWHLSPPKLAGLVLVFAAASSGAFWWLGRDLLARRSYDRALDARDRNDSAEFAARLDRATALAPHDPYFTHQRAGALIADLATTREPAARGRLLQEIVARLDASLATGVHEEYAHFNLGWLLLELGRPRDAARHFVATAQLVPDKGGVYFGLGLALQAAGRERAAIRAFALEWISDPSQLTSPAWEIPVLAPLRPAVRVETMRLYEELRTRDSSAAAAEAWTRWWLGEAVSEEQLRRGFTTDATRFAAALPALARGDSLELADAQRPWGRVYTAWRAGDFGSLAHQDAAFAAALARRAAKSSGDFQSFLVAGTGDENALVRVLFRQRTGYGVLALHPDGPVLRDVYIVQENRVVSEFAADLFPPKGWLPGRFLLALLPRDL